MHACVCVCVSVPLSTCVSKDKAPSLLVQQWRFYIGARGAQAPQILPRSPKFLDTIVLLLVELIGSIVNFA